MSAFLLDTNVMSMLSPSRAAEADAFIGWLEKEDAQGRVFLSVVTIHEIEKGVGLLESKRAVTKAAGLRLWLSGLVSAYQDKILALTTEVAMVSGQLEAGAAAKGHNLGMADALIAGTAKAHGLTIVTRNLRHFQPFGIAALSPDDAVRGGA